MVWTVLSLPTRGKPLASSLTCDLGLLLIPHILILAQLSVQRMGFGMGRSLVVILALLVMFSAAATVTPLASFNASGVVTGSLSVNITAPQQNIYLQTSYAMISWDATDTEHNITSFLVYLDSLTEPRTTGQTQFNLTGLADGPHYVVVRAFNDVGGVAEDSVFFFIDTVPPVLSIVSPGSNTYLNYSDVTVTWQATDSANIAYFEASLDSYPLITPIAFNRSSHTFSDLSDGHHNITVIAHGWGGRTTSATVSFDVDTTYPTANITYPADNAGFNHADVTVVWNGVDAGGDIQGYQIWVDGVKMITAVPTDNQFTRNYTDGYHTVRIVAVDIASSTAADEVTFLVDTVAPGIVSVLPEGDQEPVGTTIVVNFTKPMDHEATDITILGVSGAVSWDGTALTFTPLSDLAYGTTYTVTVSGKDLVGAPMTKSWTFTTTDMGTVSGVVTDNNGNPLAGVSVSLDKGVAVITNDAGAFSFSTHAGPHELTLSKTGWDGRTVPVPCSRGRPAGWVRSASRRAIPWPSMGSSLPSPGWPSWPS